MIRCDDIAARARTYMGVPYSHLGRSRRGVDCIGLVICVARDLGLVAPDFDVAHYSRYPQAGVLEGELAQYLLASAGDLQSGQVVTLKIHRMPFHVGIIGTGPGGTVRLIHSYISTGCVCEHTLDGKWSRRISRAWTFPRVRYG